MLSVRRLEMRPARCRGVRLTGDGRPSHHFPKCKFAAVSRGYLATWSAGLRPLVIFDTFRRTGCYVPGWAPNMRARSFPKGTRAPTRERERSVHTRTEWVLTIATAFCARAAKVVDPDDDEWRECFTELRDVFASCVPPPSGQPQPHVASVPLAGSPARANGQA